MKGLLHDGYNLNKSVKAHDRGACTTVPPEWPSPIEHELAVAQYNLGVLYDNGQGVSQDFAEALDLYRRAAGHCLAVAQYNLGLMYAEGDGVPPDYVQAFMWFNLASLQGYEKANKNRDIAAEKMSSEQIAEAERKTREWLAALPQKTSS